MNIKNAWHVLWYGLPEREIKEVVKVQTLTVNKPSPDYDVTRHQLGSIGHEDIKDAKVWLEPDRKNHNSEMALIHQKKGFKLEIDNLKEAQAYFCALNAQDNRQLDFARGTINGISLVFERIEVLAGEHYSITKPQEEIDKYGVLPESPVSAATMDRL